jgi:hypothetical protein
VSEESDVAGPGAADGTPEPTPEQQDAIDQVSSALDEARRRLAEAPAEVVVTNHVMGLYELAAIHLSAEQPNLPAASLAIDAMACLVDGLGDRLGEHTGTLRDALTTIRMAFVEVKRRATTSS